MNVLLILGHPRADSLCGALFEAYREGAEAAGARVETLVLADMDFDVHVRAESPEQQHYEPDIRRARELIGWAEHLVFVYPTWWGTMPALLKGFLDRIITPEFAFHFRHPDKPGWDRLWAGKTSQVITSMDTPPLIYRGLFRAPGNNAMRRATLGFCGVKSCRAINFGSVRLSTPEQRQTWIERARRAGFALRGNTVTRWRDRLATWLRALRLQFYPMTWAAYTIGALVAAGSGAFSTAVYWWGYLCLFALEAAVVFSNDFFDYGSDRCNQAAGPFNGGSRMLVERKLDFGALRDAIVLGVVAALVCAAFAILLAPQPGTVAALLAGVFVFTLGYTVPPLKLCWRGLGELDVAVSHSFMVLLAGYLLQGGAWRAPLPWLLALPLCIAVLPAIILSGLPDRRADASVGKRTLPVRLGARGAVWLAIGLVAAATAAGVVASRVAITQRVYHGIVWGMVPHAAILVLALLHLLNRHPDPADRRIDGVMVIALAYILWFVVVPFWNLV